MSAQCMAHHGVGAVVDLDEAVEIDVHGSRHGDVRPLSEHDDIPEVLTPPGRRHARRRGRRRDRDVTQPCLPGAESLGGQPIEHIGKRTGRGAADERESLPRPRRQIHEQPFDLRTQRQRDVLLVALDTESTRSNQRKPTGCSHADRRCSGGSPASRPALVVTPRPYRLAATTEGPFMDGGA